MPDFVFKMQGKNFSIVTDSCLVSTLRLRHDCRFAGHLTISTMKKQPTIKTFVGAVLFALLSQSSLLAQDAHVSLWNFDSGDLSATAGADMEYMEDTGDLVTFGTTEALGLPAVGGEVANVIQIPKLVMGQGLLATLPEDSNGDGDLVNNWTAIMDLYYPTGSSGKKRSLIDVVTAEWVAGAADAEFYVSAAN
ncbi:uncharacterized protein METZ01_LOCUS458435, partial [marine metagenome]